jgi:hypothetical protein
MKSHLRSVGFVVGVVVCAVLASATLLQRATEAQPTIAAVDSLSVGDVIMSPVDLPKFRANHGDKGPNFRWTVCDGSDAQNTGWTKATGLATVPDLRARYPRGFNSGKDGPQPFPAHVTPSYGKTEDDAFQHHAHGFFPKLNQHGGDDQPTILALERDGSGNHETVMMGDAVQAQGHDAPRLDEETRPKTTIVNFFCRIR